MNEDFRQRLDARLDAFRLWSRGRRFEGCRLVQYCGAECFGGSDVDLGGVEAEIAGLVGEGLGVDWGERGGTLYLVAWEPAGLPWTWPRVFAERHLDGTGDWTGEGSGTR